MEAKTKEFIYLKEYRLKDEHVNFIHLYEFPIKAHKLLHEFLCQLLIVGCCEMFFL
jgi:hypothetical protein